MGLSWNSDLTINSSGPAHFACDMKSLIKSFWEVCLLQKAPQDIPYSRELFLLLLLAGFLVNFLVNNLYFAHYLPETEIGSILLVVSLQALFFLTSISLLMMVMGYRMRIIQTLTALLGTDLIITLLAMPALLTISYLPALAGYFGLILFFLIIWSLVIMAHILRHALSVSFLLAGLFVIGYFMLSIKLEGFLIPATG